MREKEKMKEKKNQLLHLTSKFCDLKLDEEHKELAQKMIHSLFRKESISFNDAKIETWAAGVIHAIGSVNLLFDDSFEPYVSEDELNKYFKSDPSVTRKKSHFIKKELKLNIFDPEYSAHVSAEDDPLKDMVSIDGIYISLDLLPSYLKEKVKEVRQEGLRIEFRSDEV